VLLLFTLFMVALGFRNVSVTTLTSKVPSSAERASFSSLQSMVQHLSSACASFTSSLLLSDTADGRLAGVPTIAAISMGLTIALPFVMNAVEQRVRARALQQSGAAA
jgi:hypothetical protein